MAEVKIVYWTGTGNTQAMADLVAQGVTAGGATPKLMTFDDITPAALAEDAAFALGCPSMGVEQLEDSTVEPFNDELVSLVSGKKILLFGSYGWGDGEWMRNWAEQLTAAGAEMVVDEGVIANDAPSGDAADACVDAGRTLAGCL